ncbi:MAG: alginate lyase family protein, partial [Kiritimatiellales bacterium]
MNKKISGRNSTFLTTARIAVLIGLSCQVLWSDDFNRRPDVPYTHDGNQIGWYWQASGTGTWSLKDHEILVDNSDASLQEDNQILYNTCTSLKSGDWNASVNVRIEIATRRAGMAFMVGAGGNDYYQIRLKADSKEVQVLRRGSAGDLTIYTHTNSSSETFALEKFYTINVWSTNAAQFQWRIQNDGGTNVASSSFNDTGYTNGYAGIIKSVGDPYPDICRFDNFYVREITVPPITPSRPRLQITSNDVVNMKADISNHVEPRYSAWTNLKTRVDIWKDQTMPAPYTGGDALSFYNISTAAGRISAQLALAYQLNGDTNYAAKAKDILLTWAQATPPPGTTVPETNYFPDSGMMIARGITELIYTYDWIYDGLSPNERTVITNWFLAMLPTVQDSIDRWEGCYAFSSNDPRRYVETNNLDYAYFGRQYHQNHLASHTMAYLLIGYALGDQALVQFAVDSKENPRDYLELFEGGILMAGEVCPDVCRGDPANPPPQDGEMYDRYRHTDKGSGHTNGAGLGYAVLSLHQMMSMTETLYINGINFYTRVGAHGETLKAPFVFYADFLRLRDASIKGGFYAGESVPLYGLAVYEVANKRYPGTPEIQALLNSTNRAAAHGSSPTYFCCPTVTHGEPIIKAEDLSQIKADDFNRADTTYSTNGSAIGANWINGYISTTAASSWKINGNRLYAQSPAYVGQLVNTSLQTISGNGT